MDKAITSGLSVPVMLAIAYASVIAGSLAIASSAQPDAIPFQVGEHNHPIINGEKLTITQICSPLTYAVYDDDFHYLRNYLREGGVDSNLLSQMDALIANAKDSCLSSKRPENAVIIAELMRLLARNWAQQGHPSQANNLYRDAHEILVRYNSSVLDRMIVLEDWANLKLVMGEPQSAQVIAKSLTDEARKEYQNSTSNTDIYLNILIDALNFEISILKRTGDTNEASSAEHELEELIKLRRD